MANNNGVLGTAIPGVAASCLLLLTLGTIRSQDTHPGETVSVDLVTRLWQARESRFRDVVCEWHDRIMIAKQEQLLRNILIRQRLEGKRKRPTKPEIEAIEEEVRRKAKDTVHEETHTIKLSGNNWRIDSDGKQFNGDGELTPSTGAIAFDGDQVRSYMAEAQVGNISKFDKPKIPGLTHLRTVFYVLRPLSYDLVNLKGYRRAPGEVLVREIPCVLLEKSGNSRTEKVWVAPDRDCAMIRYTEEVRGVVLFKADFDYAFDNENGWLPTGWTVVCGNGNRVQTSITSKVLKLTLGVPVPPSDFRIDFPSGTVVRDFTEASPKTHGRGSMTFIQYEVGREWWRSPWIVIAATAIVVFVAGGVVVRRIQSRRKGGTQNV